MVFCYAIYLEIKLPINLETAWETFSSYRKSLYLPEIFSVLDCQLILGVIKATHSTIFCHEWKLKKFRILFWKEKFATSHLKFPLIFYKYQLISAMKKHFAHNTKKHMQLLKGSEVRTAICSPLFFLSRVKEVQSKEGKTTTYRSISTGLAVC